MFLHHILSKTNRCAAACALSAALLISAAGNADANDWRGEKQNYQQNGNGQYYQKVSQAFDHYRPDYRVVQRYGRNVYKPTPQGPVSEPYGNDRYGPEHLRRISPTERYPAPIMNDGMPVVPAR